MPRFEPFVGLRYDTARVDLSMVVSPPYDVISETERQHFARQHSANSVRVDLPEPDHRAGLDRYQNAAAVFASWQASGTLLADSGPCLYGYRMTTPDGFTTNGVYGALGLDQASVAGILPHEQTLAKPKGDRFSLLEATEANLSPIWGLSLTAGLTELFVSGHKSDMTATDDDEVLHQLWVIDDASVISAVRKAVAATPVVLADGHHRFETAKTFLQSVIDSGTTSLPGANSVMALIVELSEEQLRVGPVHRALSDLPDGFDLVDTFSSWFNVTKVGEPTSRTVTALGESEALALIMPSGAWLLSPKDGTAEAAGATIDSSMVALVIAELPEHAIAYCHTWQEAAEAVATERAQAVVLLRSVTVDDISEWAHSGRRMPAKTTYFHPKPRTGMVYRRLSDPLTA